MNPLAMTVIFVLTLGAFAWSALLRSLRSAATAIQGRVAANRDQLAAATPGRA